MRRLAPLLLVLVAACSTTSTAASNTSDEPSKAPASHAPKVKKDDLGCLTDLGKAENTYNDVIDGIHDGTMTDEDGAKSFGSIKSKLDDLAIVNSTPAIQAKAHAGAVHAGRLRVALLTGTSPNVADVTALRETLDALDEACQAAS